MVEQRLGYIIKRAQQALRSRMDSVLDSVGITTPQYAALSILEEEPGLSNAALARRCFLTPQTMHKIITGLDKKGFVERKSDPNHGRKIKTILTQKGQKILSQTHKMVENIELEMVKNLSNEEIEVTVTNLGKCVEALEG